MGNQVWLKRAIAAANWNAAGNWAFWNEETQQIEDYNQAPNGDDYVYLNSYIVTATATISFPNGTITNKPNPYTGLSGGRFDSGSNGGSCTIVSNIEVGNAYIMHHAGNGTFSFSVVGNVTGSDNAVVFTKGGNNQGSLTITGNMTGGLYPLMSGNTGSSVNITGTTKLKTNVGSNVTNSLRFAGRLELNNTTATGATVGTLTTIGEVYLVNGKLGACTNWVLSANIYYTGINPLNGVCTFSNISQINPDTFIIKDVTEPITQTSILIGKYQLDNTDQYPAPLNVKKDVPYAWGELIGQYLPDYPQEANVLQGVEYDGGEMVGTLDLPQAPTTSDIVTAIKNDSDLGGKINTTNTNVGNISIAVTTIDGKVDIIDTNVDTLISRLTSVLTQRLGQSVTVEILQQILTAHLNN